MSDRQDLVIRPRLYEADPHRMRVPLRDVLDPVGVRQVHATVTGATPPASAGPARDTVVVIGAGFTGIELATALASVWLLQCARPMVHVVTTMTSRGAPAVPVL